MAARHPSSDTRSGARRRPAIRPLATHPPGPDRDAAVRRDSMDWDDVRVFLAVARHGSMRAAGRALGLSQPTIARRLTAFEATFGGTALFDRLPEGLRLNAAGTQLAPAAETVEDAALRLERRRAAAAPLPCGTVRVSAGECAAGFLARCLAQRTAQALPAGVTLELVQSRESVDLARREADMALRHEPPKAGNYYVFKAGRFACSVYRRRGAEATGWVTYTEEQSHYAPARWVRQQADATGAAIALRASSMLMHLEAIRAGTGRGVLPCYVGDGHPLLERLRPPIAEIAADYWIVVHRDLRRAPGVRAVIDWIRATFGAQRDMLAGRTAAAPPGA